MLIYTTHISSRLKYIVSILFNSSDLLTTDLEKYTKHEGAKINYSTGKLAQGELQIHPHTLLFESNISAQQTNGFIWKHLPAFFKTKGDMPFDFFAASFYLLSRYEEYLPYEKDIYGRFAHTASIAHQLGFLHLPLINLWMKEISVLLSKKEIHSGELPITLQQATANHHSFSFLPTYDIDIAYSYRGKGFFRNAASLLSAAVKGNKQKIKECIQVFTALKKDPFNVYEWLQQLHKKYKLKPVYFFLAAAKSSAPK